MLENQSLAKVRSCAPDGSVIYELFRKKKKTPKEVIIDILTFSSLTVADGLKIENVYLVATEQEGIIHIFKKDSEQTLRVPDWTAEMKEGFRRTLIDGYVFRKCRRLN